MESLADMPHAKALRRALDKLPMGLDQAYQSAMERIESQRGSYRYFAKQVLSWITFALRPLKASELQHALAVEDGDSTFDSDSVSDLDIMVSACAGLVIRDQASNVIRLVHYSTKEYFEQTRMHWFPEQYFAETCLTYLSFDAFKTGSCQSDDELKDRLNSYPFLNYAANYWGEHISGNHSPHAQKLAKALLSNSGLLSSMIQIIHSPSFRFPGYSQRFPSNVSGLHIAALFGLLRVTEHLLADGVEIDDCNNYYGTPLQAAAAEGHSDVVEFLLDQDAKIDATGGRYDGAIQAAAYGGHVKVIEILLNRGADPNTMLNGRSNALHVAASNGHTAVVNTLLAAGADINARDGEFGRTALARAAWNGHESVVTCLLKSKFAKPDINALDHQDCSALHLALEKHHEAIVNILIDSRARMDVANQQQKTPAQIALQDIRRIDPSNFEFSREKSNKLKRGVQAQVEVMKRKGSQNARQVLEFFLANLSL
jgi:ankyrin repeat protein